MTLQGRAECPGMIFSVCGRNMSIFTEKACDGHKEGSHTTVGMDPAQLMIAQIFTPSSGDVRNTSTRA